MAKYSFEQKKKLVMAYLNGEGGTETIAKKYGYSSHAQLQRWIASYQKYGNEGLRRSRRNKKFSFKQKIHVVELYLSNEISYQDLALQEGITNSVMIANWVNRFRIAGPDALRPHREGRKKTLDNHKHKHTLPNPDEITVDTSNEHVKELEDELLKLRIENAFLKELRRLRLEDEKKMREWHSSSTASEENSN